jgi:hypothetical protein
MQIRNVGSNETPYHVLSGFGCALIAAGVAVEVLPAITPKQTGALTWSAARGPAVADTELQPCIFFSGCPACRLEAGYMTGATAHLTQRIFHCGDFESVPKEVGEQYAKLHEDFQRRQARKRRLED